MILIALGANLPSRLGAPGETLEAAKAELARRGVILLKSSRTIVTAPVPASDQPDYHNAVIEVSTGLGPAALHQLLKGVERDFGRSHDEEKDAARILDLDLLAYGRQVVAGKDLQVPHPRMHQRAFVLAPLCEIAPGWSHPVLGLTAAELFHSLPENVSCETGLAGRAA